MSLATSCPACGTTFRVAEEQLQASEGWVRCGHCHQIFDALERLFDLDHPPQQATPEAPTAAALPATASSTALPPVAAASPGDDATEVAHAADWAETRPALFGDESVLLQPSQPESTDVSLLDTGSSDLRAAPRALQMHDGATLHLLEDVGSAVPAQDAAARPALTGDIENDAASATVFLVESGMGDDDTHEEASHKLIQELEPSSAVQIPALPAQTHPPKNTASSAASKAAETTLASTKSSPTAEIAAGASTVSPASRRRTKGGSTKSSTAAAALSPVQDEDAPTVDTAGLPAFLRKANQDARWRQPWIRLLLSLIGLLALLALVIQMGYQWRDLMAARLPALRPELALGCQWLGCQLAPPRVLEAVVVDNTALTRPPGMTEGYRLSIALRNKADHDIAAPSMELTLTDTANAVLSRRVLHPSDFGVSQPVLSAQADAAWQLVFLSPETRITGYTVRAFYP